MEVGLEPRTITDVLRRDRGFGLEVPEGKGWVRLPCPYCGGAGDRPPGVVNHEIGWFYCHKCEKKRSATHDMSVASRFAAVLRQAAYAAWRQFPSVFADMSEARAHANERLAVYGGPDDGTWAESGALARWEKKAASQDQLDSFVLHALNCDLIDCAEADPLPNVMSDASVRRARGCRGGQDRPEMRACLQACAQRVAYGFGARAPSGSRGCQSLVGGIGEGYGELARRGRSRRRAKQVAT